MPTPYNLSAVHRDRIKTHLREIGKISNPGAPRWTRLAFTEDEQRIHDHAEAVFNTLGCRVHKDPFLNLYGELNHGHSGGYVLLGTHLDTVPEGGNYDGVVGFIVAVEAVLRARELGLPLPNIEFVVFRAEESSRFAASCLGSRAAFGMLDRGQVDRLRCREPNGAILGLRDVLLSKAETSLSKLGQPLVDPARYRAYLETHIEQAESLTKAHALGIVTSARAPERWNVTFSGPKAPLAAAAAIRSVEQVALMFDQAGRDIVATVGTVDGFFVGAGSINKIPGSVEFSVDSLKDVDVNGAERIAAARGCKLELGSPGTLRVKGQSNHSGGTSMGRRHRRDALATAAEIVGESGPLRSVTGDSVVLGIDIRSNDLAARHEVRNTCFAAFRAVAQIFGVHLIIPETPREEGLPVPSFDEPLRQMIADAGAALGVKLVETPSFAGHDAMIAFHAGIASAMLFVPSRRGISHNPREFTRYADIDHAIRIMTHVLAALAVR